MSRLSLADWPSSQPVLRLPHPYQTAYFCSAVQTSDSTPTSTQFYKLHPEESSTQPPEPLHNATLSFSEPKDLKSSERPPEANNTAWARARRSPSTTLSWTQADTNGAAPTLAQAWLVVYTLFTIRPDEEFIRLTLDGASHDTLAAQLRATMLAVDHPQEENTHHNNNDSSQTSPANELVLLRAAFWQGAASPFGARSIWVPTDTSPGSPYATATLPPLTHTLSSNSSNGSSNGVPIWHPRRAPKPRPGSTIYSRWIPHLRETFSMVALDAANEEHVQLFHKWQNDPRVSQGWQRVVGGPALAQHREYLATVDGDAHRTAVLAAFDGVFFAYFEVYWAREDVLGAMYADAHSEFDRGRHSLVGEVAYRGAHRVGAWWSSLMHYLFLDDARTMRVVGEPKIANATVLAYDLVHGFGVDKFVDLPHMRGALMKCSRERFFQICPLAEDQTTRGKVVGGTMVGLVAKL